MRSLPVLVWIVLLALALPLPAQSVSGEKEGGLNFYFPYEPRLLHSLTELPASVRARLDAHLQERLGASFAGRLQFSTAQAVDIAELARTRPNSNPHREVPAYEVIFSLALPEVGVERFLCSVELRADGSVIHEITLPAFAREPTKATLVPFKVAVEKVAADGRVDPRLAKAEVLYDRKADTLVYCFTQQTAEDAVAVRFRNVEVSAHDGTILRRYDSVGVR